jgi:UDP-N-acetyl-2-amino-2-deoxyglucuronate dehydrogenase
MAELQFALVGCGRIAKKHAEILARGHVQGGQLAAVCDVIPERAETMGTKYGVPWFSSSHEMMQSAVPIDVVIILTPSGMHARNTIELAPYKKHIVVEKPMALTIDDADEMIRTCDLNGIRLFVVKQNRYNRAVQKLRKALEAGRFGKLVMGSVRVRWCRPQSYYDQDEWRGTWEQDGGVFANQASHHIDLLEWMMGEPESVFARSRTALVDIETEDTGVAIIRFRNGSLGVVEATNATRPKDLEGSLSVLGEMGTVVIGGFAVNRIDTWNFLESRPEDEPSKDDSEQPKNVYGFGHIPYLEHVVDCIQNNRKALVDGLVGRRSLELISAIYESIETGKEVTLRFHPEKCRLGLPSKR